MKFKAFIWLAFLFLMTLTACSKSHFRVQTDGVEIYIQEHECLQSHKVKLRVVDADIIQVLATVEKKFSKELSLIADPDLTLNSQFEVYSEGDFVCLSTD